MLNRMMCLVALFGCWMSGVAKADYMYSLAFTADGSSVSSFSGKEGGSLSIPVYLVETGSRGLGPDGLADGLGLANSSFDFSSGTSTLTSFSNSLSVLEASVDSSYQIIVNGFPPGVLGTPFIGGQSVQVGNLNLTLGPVGSSSIALAASTNLFVPDTYTLIPAAGLPVNGLSGAFASSTLNVTAVPEPSFVALLSSAACVLALRRKRKG